MGAREDAAWTRDQNREEGEMAGEKLPFGVERGADRLGDAEHDAAHKRAPQTAEPADDYGFKGEDEAAGADGRIKIRAQAEKQGGDRADGRFQKGLFAARHEDGG